MEVFLDTETTGLNPASDEILEVAIVSETGETLFHSLVRPVRNASWPEAERIHGISPEMVADAPTLPEIMGSIRAAVDGHDLIIYNAAFDLAFLPGIEPAAVHCCMEDFAEHYGEWSEYHGNYRWQRLGTAAAYVHHTDVPNHRALADALACRAVWRYLSDPEEMRRAEALREERRLSEEAEQYLRFREWDLKHRARNFSDFMTGFLCRWWLREPAASHWTKGAATRNVCEDYAQLFFGRSLAFLEAERQYTKIFAARREVPPDLWPAGRFPKFRWYRDELEWSGFGYIQRGTIHPLYHASEKERIEKEFSLRLREERPVYWTSDLRRLGYSKAQIQSMTPYAERLGRLSGNWYYVYLKSEVERIAPARPRAAESDASWRGGSGETLPGEYYMDSAASLPR